MVFLLSGAIIGGLAFAAYQPISRALDEVTRSSRLAITNFVSEQISGTVSYSSIAPSIFSSIEIRDFAWQSEGISFSARRIRIYYSIFDVLAGNIAASPRDIRVEDGQFTAVVEPARPASGSGDGGPGGDGVVAAGPGTIPELLDVALPALAQLPTEARLSFRRISASLNIEGLDYSFRLDQGEVDHRAGQLHANIYLAWLAPLPLVGIAGGSANLRLDVDEEARRLDLFTMFGPSRSEAGNLGSVNFQTTLSDEGLAVVKTFDSRPFDASLRAGANLSSFQVQFLASDWTPSAFFDFAGLRLNPALSSFLDGQLSGGFDIDIDSVDGSSNIAVAYKADLTYSGGIRLGSSEEPGRIRIEVNGDEKLATIGSLVLDGYLGSAFSYAGVFDFTQGLPLGTLRVDTGGIFEFGRIRANFRSFKDEARQFVIESESFDLFGLPISEPRIIAQKTPDYWALDLELPFDAPDAGAAQPGEPPTAARSLVALSGNIYSQELIPGPNEAFDFSLRGQRLYLSKFGPLLPALLGRDSLQEIGISQEATVDFASSLSSDGTALLVDFETVKFDNLSPYMDSLSTAFTFANSELLVHSLDGVLTLPDLDPVTLAGSGSVSFSDGPQATQWVKADILLDDERQTLDARFANDTVEVRVNSRLRVLAEFPRPSRAAVEPVRIFIESDNFELPAFLKLDSVGPIHASGAGGFFPDGRWEIHDLELELPGARIPGFENEESRLALELAGNLDAFSVPEFSFSNGGDEFTGSGAGQTLANVAGLPTTSFEFQARNATTNESVTLNATVENRRIRGEAAVQSLLARRLGLTDLTGLLGFRLALDSSIEDFSDASLTFQVGVNSLRYKGDLFQGQVTGRLDGRAVFLDTSDILFGRTKLGLVDAYFNLRDNRGDVEVNIDELLNIRAGFDLSGTLDAPEDTVEGLSGRLQITGLPKLITPSGAVELEVRGRGRAFEFVGGPGNSVSGRLGLDGDFEIRTGSAFGAVLQGSGTIIDGEFNVNFPVVQLAKADLESSFDFGVYKMKTADLTGNLRLTGAINDPAFFGLLTVSNLRSSLDYLSEDFVPVNTYLIFEADRMYIPETIIDNRGSRVTVEGEMAFQRWLPRDFKFVFSIAGGAGLPVSHDFASVVIDGMASGTIVLEGDPGITSVYGDLTVEEASVTLSPDRQSAPAAESDTTTLVDLVFRLGRGVEFFWPAREVPIFRLLAEQGSTIDFSLNSANNTYNLTGSVPLRGGELYYPDRNYYLQEGTITFNENEDRFNPRVSLLAEARTRWQEQRITLFLTIDENFLDSLEPRITSNPPLGQQELAAIVGGSFFPGLAESDHNFLGEALLVTTDVISQFGIFREFETNVRNTLGLDVFSIRTGLFRNILRDIVLPDEAANYQNLVGRYFSNTTIQMGKILGDDVFLELMLEVGETNPAIPSAVNAFGLSLNPEFRIEWQTPFFLIEWNWAPTNAENLFVTDQRLTFSWDFY